VWCVSHTIGSQGLCHRLSPTDTVITFLKVSQEREESLVQRLSVPSFTTLRVKEKEENRTGRVSLSRKINCRTSGLLLPKIIQTLANPTVMVIQQWSKQSFHPHHPGGVSTPPIGFFFFYKFVGKMLNFSVKKRDYSLTS
jgi:hypothetical protein